MLVLNEAAVPPNVLARAEMEAARIYRRLGINLTWSHGTDVQPLFTIKIVAAAFSPREVHPRALGVAPSFEGLNGKVAYAFYRRIQDFSDSHRVEVSPILGVVIAHELGHLLLPYHSHAASGLMSDGWGKELAVRAAKGLLTFSKSESTLIRNRLIREVAAIHARRTVRGVSVRAVEGEDVAILRCT